MKIGVLKEIKVQEHRVALTPTGTRALVEAGHRVPVETGAGLGPGFPDLEYRDVHALLRSQHARCLSAHFDHRPDRGNAAVGVATGKEGVDVLRRDAGLAKGLTPYEGQITSDAVATALGMTDRYHPLAEL